MTHATCIEHIDVEGVQCSTSACEETTLLPRLTGKGQSLSSTPSDHAATTLERTAFVALLGELARKAALFDKTMIISQDSNATPMSQNKALAEAE